MENKIIMLDVKWFCPAIEALIGLLLELTSLFFVFILFKAIGEWYIGINFEPDILLSLVVLPAIYLLKDLRKVFEPYFIKVNISETEVVVRSGIFTQRTDYLKLKNVENIEVVLTILGNIRNYGTLNLYAYGSWVQIPNITDYLEHKERIENYIKTNEENV